MKAVVFAGLAALALVGTVQLRAQEDERQLTGIVVERTTGTPIVNALISIEGLGNTYSDTAGQFSFRGQFDGPLILKVRRIGFGWVDAKVNSGQEGPLNLMVELPAVAFAMEPISVSITDPSLTSGLLNGFIQRMHERRGRFVTRQDIVRRRPQQISDMFSRYRTRSSSFRRELRTSAPCGLLGSPPCPEFLPVRPVSLGWGAPGLHYSDVPCVTYYVNNLRITHVDIDLMVDPDDVLGLEVYRSYRTPLQFPAACRGGDVIVIWTE